MDHDEQWEVRARYAVEGGWGRPHYGALLRLLDAERNKVAEIIALHHEDEDVRFVSRCAECIKFWPCPTAQALGVTE